MILAEMSLPVILSGILQKLAASQFLAKGVGGVVGEGGGGGFGRALAIGVEADGAYIEPTGHHFVFPIFGRMIPISKFSGERTGKR